MKARSRWANSSNESCNTHEYYLNEKSTLGKLLAEKSVIVPDIQNDETIFFVIVGLN